MPTLNPGYFDIKQNREPAREPICTAAIAPDAMHDDAVSVTWLGLAALAITIAGAIFAA